MCRAKPHVAAVLLRKQRNSCTNIWILTDSSRERCYARPVTHDMLPGLRCWRVLSKRTCVAQCGMLSARFRALYHSEASKCTGSMQSCKAIAWLQGCTCRACDRGAGVHGRGNVLYCDDVTTACPRMSLRDAEASYELQRAMIGSQNMHECVGQLPRSASCKRTVSRRSASPYAAHHRSRTRERSATLLNC